MAKRFRGGKFPFKMVLAAFIVILIALLFFNMRGIREGNNSPLAQQNAYVKNAQQPKLTNVSVGRPPTRDG
jgi:hypothetical protein